MFSEKLIDKRGKFHELVAWQMDLQVNCHRNFVSGYLNFGIPIQSQHHRCNEPEFGQTLGDGEGQGDLACCSPWGLKEPRLGD